MRGSMMKFRMILISLVLLFTSELSLAAGVTCSKQAIDGYIASVQMLSATAIAEGTGLLQCPSFQEQVVQWQAFLLSMNGYKTASQQVDVKSTSPNLDPLIAKAKSGDYSTLLHKFDNHDVRYTNNPDALLVLARTMTRKGQFARGREIYQTFLKLRPDDDDATAESLYSWIWQGDLISAEAQFVAASRWRNRPEFAAQVQRGLDLISKLKGGNPPTTEIIGSDSKKESLMSVAGGVHAIGEVYLRHTASATYNGVIDVNLSGHQIDDLALSNNSQLASEASLGFTLYRPSGYGLAAHVGYFSLGESNVFGDIRATAPLKWHSQITVGGYRRPLALLLPLTDDASGFMRDAIYVGGKLNRFAEFQVELRKEEEFAPHEWDQLIFKWPYVESATDEVTFRLPLQYFNQPQPNPNYDTYEVTTLVGAGMGWRRQLASGWEVRLDGDYYLVFMTPRMGGSDPDQTGLLVAAGEIKMPFNEFWALHAQGRFAWALDPEYVRRRGEISHATLGLNYSR